MSLYNIINGYNPATFIILPMLGRNPMQYPRFRDCFIAEKNQLELKEPNQFNDNELFIVVYTRTGGNNRYEYDTEIQEMRNMPNYVDDYDDDSDETYAYFIFSVPEKYKIDFQKIMNGQLEQVSDSYLAELKTIFPKDSERLIKLFKK